MKFSSCSRTDVKRVVECCGGTEGSEVPRGGSKYEFQLQDKEYTIEEEVEEQIEFMKSIRDEHTEEPVPPGGKNRRQYRWNTVKLMLDGVMER